VFLTRGMLSNNAATTGGKGENLLHLGRARNQKKGAISEFPTKGHRFPMSWSLEGSCSSRCSVSLSPLPLSAVVLSVLLCRWVMCLVYFLPPSRGFCGEPRGKFHVGPLLTILMRAQMASRVGGIHSRALFQRPRSVYFLRICRASKVANRAAGGAKRASSAPSPAGGVRPARGEASRRTANRKILDPIDAVSRHFDRTGFEALAVDRPCPWTKPPKLCPWATLAVDPCTAILTV
jgi:hypothetical protein